MAVQYWTGDAADDGRRVPQTATALVRRELTTLALIAQAVWLVASSDLRPTLLPPAGIVGLVVAVAGWLLLLVTQVRGGGRERRWARYLDVGAVALAGVVVRLTTEAPWEAAASLAVLCAILIGTLIEIPVGAVLIGVLAAVSLEPIARLTDALPDADGVTSASVSLYVLLIGGCLLGVRAVLERNARRIDADTLHRDDIEQQRRTVEGVEDALKRQERLLHETVLNTLTAIDRGGLARDRSTQEVLHSRCQEAIGVLTGLETGAQAVGPAVRVSPTGFVHLPDDLVAFIDGMRAEGLVVDVVTDSLEEVPDRVRDALMTATREALANAARHASASRVWVLVRVHRRDGFDVRVEVRDDGVGFDARQVRGRFGLSRAIVDPMEEVGGSAAIESRPGSGTKVVLQWAARSGDAIDRFRASTGAFALSSMGIFGVYIAATAALAWLQFGHPPATATDLALVVVLGLLISLATPEAPLPWGLVVTISALGPLFALLELSGAEASPFGNGWALSAIAALFMTAAALGPPWAWVLLVVSWLLVDADPVGGVFQPATLVVIGGAVFGRSLRRDTARMQEAHDQRAQASTGLEVTRESLSRLRARYGPLEDSEAVALLTDIASGAADPDDPQVRRRAGREEAFIRNLIRVDPQSDPLRTLVADLSWRAHARAASLTADLSLPAVPDVVVPPDMEESWGRAVDVMDRDGTARLTARVEGDAVVATLLVPIAKGEREAMRALPWGGVPSDPTDPDDPVMLWIARLGRGRP